MQKDIFVHISVLYTHTALSTTVTMEMNAPVPSLAQLFGIELKSFSFYLFRLIYLFLKMWNI